MTRTIPHGKTRRSGPGLWYRVSHMDDSVSPAISEARTTGIYRDDRLFAEPQSVADGVLHASLYSKRCARYSRRDCCDASFAFACAAIQQRRPSRSIAAGVQAWPRRRAEPRRLRFRRFPSTRRVRFQADRLRFRSLVSSRADRIRFPHTVCNAAFVSTPFPPSASRASLPGAALPAFTQILLPRDSCFRDLAGAHDIALHWLRCRGVFPVRADALSLLLSYAALETRH